MIRRARSFFRDSEPAVATTVGVVGGVALYNLFLAIGYGFVTPVFVQRLMTGRRAFQFTLGGVTFGYEGLVVDLTALLLLAAVAYVLFIWHADESLDGDPDTRDCPDCKSEIHIDARRCPYCTSVVSPIADVADGV
jgi:large conductance mechanosensitive channel